MTEIQERLMLLMDEIDSICQKENLKYVLANQTAGRAMKNHEFTSFAYDFQIIMPIDDIIKLQAYVETHRMENRAFESWKDNSDMRDFVFRYVDKGSLLIDGSSGDYFTKPGIAVTIVPACKRNVGSGVRGCERYILMLNKDGRKGRIFCIEILCVKLAARLIGMRRVKKLLGIPYLDSYIENTGGIHFGLLKSFSMGKDKMAAWLVEQQLDEKYPVSEDYWYLNNIGRMIHLPAKFFDKTAKIEFEGRSLPVSSDPDMYFSRVFGKNWKADSVKGTPGTARVRVIVEPDLSYEEYLEFIDGKGKTLKEVQLFKREYDVWMAQEYYPMEKKVNRTFQRVRRSVDRIDVWHKLKSKRPKLKEAYENRDVDTLRSLLKEYLKRTDEYYADKIGFYIDEELFSCAKLIWEADGKTDYAEKVYDCVPELYKKESVDDYFAKRSDSK